MSELEYKAAYQDYLSFLADYKPQLSIGGDIPGLTRSISSIIQPDGSILFIPQSQMFSNIQLNVLQRVPLTGGTVFASSSLFNRLALDNTSDIFWQATPIQIGLNQPLFQFNSMKWDRNEQKLRYDLTKVNYVYQLEQLSAQVTQTYFEALIAKVNMEISSFNLESNDTIFTISKGRYSVGKIAENELLQSELTYMNARANFQQAKRAYNQSIQKLKTLLGIDASEDVILEIPEDIPSVQIDPQVAVTYAKQYSYLTQNFALERMQSERSVKQAEKSNRFSANIGATFGLNQTGATLGEAYKQPFDQETFSINFNIPLLQWGKRQAVIEAAKIRRERTETSIKQETLKFSNQVYYQAVNLDEYRTQLDLSSRADTIARRRYEIARSRYLIGKIGIQDLIIAQNEKDGARQSYLINLRQFWQAYADLRATTLYDFESERPIEP